MRFTNCGVGLSPNLNVQLNTIGCILQKTIFTLRSGKLHFHGSPETVHSEISTSRTLIYKQECERWLKHPLKWKKIYSFLFELCSNFMLKHFSALTKIWIRPLASNTDLLLAEPDVFRTVEIDPKIKNTKNTRKNL